MRLGEALVAAGLITEDQLTKALEAQSRYPHLSLGQVVSKLLSVPRPEVETCYLQMIIIPTVEKWLHDHLDKKTVGIGGLVAEHISSVELTVPTFTRYGGEIISFSRQEDGPYQESNALRRIERIRLTIDPMVIHIGHHKSISLKEVHLEVNLLDKGVRPDNPGFLAELKLLIIKAIKDRNEA